MNKEQYITKLTKIWYKLVNLDHHKDKDCHWYISMVWSYGEKPYYRVEHYGYVYDEVIEGGLTYNEAIQFLLDTLTHAIKSEEQWAKKVLGETEYYDEEAIKKAKDILEIVGRYTTNEGSKE